MVKAELSKQKTTPSSKSSTTLMSVFCCSCGAGGGSVGADGPGPVVFRPCQVPRFRISQSAFLVHELSILPTIRLLEAFCCASALPGSLAASRGCRWVGRAAVFGFRLGTCPPEGLEFVPSPCLTKIIWGGSVAKMTELACFEGLDA